MVLARSVRIRLTHRGDPFDFCRLPPVTVGVSATGCRTGGALPIRTPTQNSLGSSTGRLLRRARGCCLACPPPGRAVPGSPTVRHAGLSVQLQSPGSVAQRPAPSCPCSGCPALRNARNCESQEPERPILLRPGNRGIILRNIIFCQNFMISAKNVSLFHYCALAEDGLPGHKSSRFSRFS